MRIANIRSVPISFPVPAEKSVRLGIGRSVKRDSVLGPLDAEVVVDGDSIVVDGKAIKILAVRDPKELPWGELGVDVVVESTGIFTSRDQAAAHLEGAGLDTPRPSSFSSSLGIIYGTMVSALVSPARPAGPNEQPSQQRII